MRAPRLPELKRLKRALDAGFKIESNCLPLTAAFVLDVPGSIMRFATFDPATEEMLAANPALSTVPFIHAFAEFRGFAYAPTTLSQTDGQLVAMDLAGYLEVNGARDFHQLTRPALLRFDREHGLSRALRLGIRLRGDVPIGGALLDAAGVPWKDYGDGGVVPRHVEELAA